MQEAIIPDAAKALWQDVLEHEPQEVFAGEGAVLCFTRVAFDIAERHLAIAVGDDVVFTDDAAVQTGFSSGERGPSPI